MPGFAAAVAGVLAEFPEVWVITWQRVGRNAEEGHEEAES